LSIELTVSIRQPYCLLFHTSYRPHTSGLTAVA
jgi:hypothetical protein